MRILFFDKRGTYTFATRDEKPTATEALAHLRFVAQTREGMASLRDLLQSLDLAPELSEIDDEQVLVMLSEKVVSGAFRSWAAAPLAAPVIEERKPEPAPPEPQPAVAPPAEETPPPSPQAETFINAAKSGRPVCEICERLRASPTDHQAPPTDEAPPPSTAQPGEDAPRQDLEGEPQPPSPAQSQSLTPEQERQGRSQAKTLRSASESGRPLCEV